MYDQFYSFILFRETILNNNKRVIQAVYTDKHLCTHEYVPVSCCPRPSQKPPTLVFFTEYHFYKPIMPYKTFKKLFWWTHVILFYYNLTASVNDWTSLPTSRSNYHMSTLKYEQQKISIFVTGRTSNTQIMKMKNFRMF